MGCIEWKELPRYIAVETSVGRFRIAELKHRENTWLLPEYLTFEGHMTRSEANVKLQELQRALELTAADRASDQLSSCRS